MEQTTTYLGERGHKAGDGMLHGPVWIAAMAFAQAPIFGAAKLLVAHLLSAGFLSLLAVSMASLAGRIGARPLPTALAGALGPVTYVLSTGLMTDLPMVALFTASVALALRGVERDRLPSLIGAGVLAALAGATRYHGVAAIPLLLVLPLFLRPVRARYFLPGFVGLFGFAGLLTCLLTVTGRWDIFRATGQMAAIEIDRTQCLLATVCAIGGALIGYVPGILIAAPRIGRALLARRVVATMALAGAGLGLYSAWLAPQVARLTPPGANLWLQWALFALGGVALGLGLVPFLPFGRRGESSKFQVRPGLLAWLCLWFGGFAIAAWLTVPFGSVRYVLPVVPGLLLLAGWLATNLLSARLHALCAGVSVAFGLAAATADYRSAAVYPELARFVSEREASDWESGETWIWGEIDFRWYLERDVGLRILAGDSTEPQPGDRILKSMMVATASPNDGTSGGYRLHPELIRRMQSGLQREYNDPFPVRIHSSWAGAGFYGAQAGFLPFSFTTATRDILQVWDVVGGNPFFANFELARRETFTEPQVAGGNLRVQRFLAHPEQAQHLALSLTFPGRVTYDEVPIPSDAELSFELAEHSRVWSFEEPGPPVMARVRIDGEPVFEQRSDARREESQRGWQSIRVDLSRFAGQTVSLAFEAEALPLVEPMPESLEPALAERLQKYVLLGFGEPRLESSP